MITRRDFIFIAPVVLAGFVLRQKQKQPMQVSAAPETANWGVPWRVSWQIGSQPRPYTAYLPTVRND